jgi:enolase
MKMKIEKVWAREVLDSRGNPTVEAELTVGGKIITAIAPSGASTGTWEAHELRDGGTRYKGKGVLKAVENIRKEMSKALVGMDPSDQRTIDYALIDLDGTDNKTRLGGNAMVAVSLAAVKAGAYAMNKEVYEHVGDNQVTLPVPMFNIINGGKHAGGDLKIQECMIIPAGATSFSECLRMSAEIYAELKSILKKSYGAGAVNIGDEGGFAPPLSTVEEALETIMSSISQAGYSPGKDVLLAIDAASSEFYHDGIYDVDGMKLSAGELADHYASLTEKFPLISIEDPFFEDDFDTTAELTSMIGKKVQIVGDDIFVTNTGRLCKGIEMGAANALLLKVNQIGTVTESADAALMSFENGYNVVVSHRSGETEDTTIADLSVGWGTGQIKTGAPARGERTAKYNRLLRIEERLGSKAVFPGKKVFRSR